MASPTKPIPLSALAIRAAKDEDKEWCWQLHRSTLYSVVDQIWGWDEDWQRRHFDKEWPSREAQIVSFEGQRVGLFEALHRPHEIRLALIEVDVSMQGRGIGSALLQHLQARAQQRGLPLALEVFKVNRGAQRLYKRHGFVETEDPDHKICMRWDPHSSYETSESPDGAVTTSC